MAPVYRNSTENNAVRLNGDRTRRAEIFETEHALTASKTNNETLTGRVTEPTTKTPTVSHNRYTVSQNARTQDFGSKRQTVTTNEGKRDKGWEMMQRRKEESESQVRVLYSCSCIYVLLQNACMQFVCSDFILNCMHCMFATPYLYLDLDKMDSALSVYAIFS